MMDSAGETPQPDFQSAYRMASFLAGAGVGGVFVAAIAGGGYRPNDLLLASVGIVILGIVAFAYVKVEHERYE